MDADVIVSGSGPGGSTAAAILAKQGLNVLLVDKAKFPRPKVCGDGIPPAALGLLNELSVGEKISASNPNEITKGTIVSPKKKSITLDIKLQEKFYIFPRFIFDKILHDHALECGAHFVQAKVKAPILEGNKVVGVQVLENGVTKEYLSKLVIAADGVNSKISSVLRKDKQAKEHQSITLRGYLSGFDIQKNIIEGHSLQEIFPGYLWIFPIGEDKINIGLGMRMDMYQMREISLKKILDDFLKRPEIKDRLSANWELTELSGSTQKLASQYPIQRVYNGAILVGDAGAWVAPLTGGGIYNAIFTGKTAAGVCIEALKKNDTSEEQLQKYNLICHEHMWREIKLTYQIQKIISKYPFLANVSFKMLNKKVLKLFRLYEDVDF